ncbi:MAG: ANTAR domain-containing protein [Gemmatimonadetes bacterium]|nr:ANTAR domain-containing protein [Gemmatimonadota bacterium]
MDILLADDRSPGARMLPSVIEALGHRVVGPVSGAREAVLLVRQRKVDLVILAVEDAAAAAEEISGARLLPIVVVTARSDSGVAERAAHLPVFACLAEPVPAEELDPAIRLARARFDEASVLRSRVAELSRQAEGRRTVERAKGILMEVRGLSEDEAYRLLRRESQNRGKSLAEVAGTVVSMEGVFRAGARRTPHGGVEKRAG